MNTVNSHFCTIESDPNPTEQEYEEEQLHNFIYSLVLTRLHSMQLSSFSRLPLL